MEIFIAKLKDLTRHEQKDGSFLVTEIKEIFEFKKVENKKMKEENKEPKKDVYDNIIPYFYQTSNITIKNLSFENFKNKYKNK